uniref:Large ribosomal subunit protein uL22c n=2 Tax=Vittaria TaxID=32183 RepID=A0A3G5CUT3_9MONI|nr:ribosomal protein L22 [Vittaria graminifolia]YP_009549484.1 ribosomal protein L22 [Vittaria appalachiana]AYW16460.1 ribosomal protein L22 [Vittaria graminifolia]AYW16633.1 ribosomal protein L22 [Vittaria appalachiana]
MRNKNQPKTKAQALGRNIRVSLLKMQRILDRIRYCSYEEALVSLEFMPYRACYPVSKLVLSAAANASTNLGLTKSSLFVSKTWVDNSKYLRRFRPRAQGRGYSIKKPTCQVTIQLSSKLGIK